MAVIVPTVTTLDKHAYREQIERIELFAKRIHIDFMDGDFTPTKSPDISDSWWPKGKQIDFHVMYKHPFDYVGVIKRLKPDLVIVHAEAESYPHKMHEELDKAGIKLGLAILADTHIESVRGWLKMFDHLLIFSGDLGRYGGHADLKLLDKVKMAKDTNPKLEIAWDGGINDQNAKTLVEGGVDVLNVGGFIQNAEDPAAAYAKLVASISDEKVNT